MLESVSHEIGGVSADAKTSLAPAELKPGTSFGAESPLIELDGFVLARSGAITEYLIDRFAADRLAPARGTAVNAAYLQWIHFAKKLGYVAALLRMFMCVMVRQNHLLDYAQRRLRSGVTYLGRLWRTNASLT